MEYVVYKQGTKYYVIPNVGFVGILPYPKNFLSFYFKSTAERFCKELNEAFKDGVLYGMAEIFKRSKTSV